MFNFEVTLTLENCVWSSDWSGYEVGFDEHDVVGLYRNETEDGSYNYYIDMETLELLEFWRSDE